MAMCHRRAQSALHRGPIPSCQLLRLAHLLGLGLIAGGLGHPTGVGLCYAPAQTVGSETSSGIVGRELFSIIICMAIFHTPDGQLLTVDTRHITALRPAENIKEHLTPGTKTILYVTTKTFGVRENIEEAQDAIHNCIDGSE